MPVAKHRPAAELRRRRRLPYRPLTDAHGFAPSSPMPPQMVAKRICPPARSDEVIGVEPPKHRGGAGPLAGRRWRSAGSSNSETSAFGMRRHDKLHPLGGFLQHIAHQRHRVGMQPQFRLLDTHQRRRVRRQQHREHGDEAQRAVGDARRREWACRSRFRGAGAGRFHRMIHELKRSNAREKPFHQPVEFLPLSPVFQT